MKMNLKEMKTLYTFGCPNREATVERLRYVAALTPDPAAKKLFYMLSVKLSDEKCDKWYRRFYYNLRLQMQEYYQHKAVIMDSCWNHHMERCYIKFIKPKQGAKVSADPDDYEFEDEEYENEDVPEQEEQEDQN